jgi:hypothetical protein
LTLLSRFRDHLIVIAFSALKAGSGGRRMITFAEFIRARTLEFSCSSLWGGCLAGLCLWAAVAVLFLVATPLILPRPFLVLFFRAAVAVLFLVLHLFHLAFFLFY